jgi:hypothetical protein
MTPSPSWQAPRSPVWMPPPDGTALVVRYGTDTAGATQLLPLDGSPSKSLGSGEFEFVDVQRLAP